MILVKILALKVLLWHYYPKNSVNFDVSKLALFWLFLQEMLKWAVEIPWFLAKLGLGFEIFIKTTYDIDSRKV